MISALAMFAASLAPPKLLDSQRVLQRYEARLAATKDPQTLVFLYYVSQAGPQDIDQMHRVYRSGNLVRDETLVVDGVKQKTTRIARYRNRYTLHDLAPSTARYVFLFVRPIVSNGRYDYVYRAVPLGAPTAFTANSAGVPTSFAFNYDADTRNPRVLQPRLAVAWQATRNDALRFSYGRSVQFPAIAQVDVTSPEVAYTAFRSIPSRDSVTGTTAQFCSVAAQIGALSSFNAPCASYADQLFWENQAAVEGIPITPLKPVTFNNFDFSYSHLFPHQVSVKITPFYNKSYNQIAATAQQLVKNGVPVVNINGNPVLGPQFNSNLGKSQIMGTEFLLTKEAAYGLSGSLSLTYQNEFSNVVPTTASEDFFPSIPPASLQLGNLYRVGFLSPFVGALALQERTRSGWRINPVIYYNHGYPISPGLLTATFVNGKPFNLPNTNVTNPAGLGGSAGADRYVDPRNPGPVFNPNIAATRGTPDKAAAGGVLSAARFTPVQITFEYQSPRNPRAGTFGAVVFNVFNQLYGQPALNTRYQPIATGIAGPYSGYSSSANQVQPGFYGISNFYPFRGGNRAYLLTPNGLPRTVQFYYQLNL